MGSTIGNRGSELIRQIDVALNRAAESLDRAQPPYSGKIVVNFVDEGAELRTPIVQRIRVTRAGVFLPERLTNKRLGTKASKKSSFAINREFVVELLGEVEYLVKTRAEINVKLRQMRHWENMFCRSHEVKVEESKGRINDIQTDVIENLRHRKTRKSKDEERVRDGVEVITVANKHWAKNQRKKGITTEKRRAAVID